MTQLDDAKALLPNILCVAVSYCK